MPILTYDKDNFYIDGEKTRILSGAIHYFRVVPEYWEDRLTKLKAMGLNTVETYMCWNLHERSEGKFDFDGILDVSKFIGIAERLGLYVIVRPGPYICAEWDFGGLPGWLQAIPGLRYRCADKVYLEKVRNYIKRVCDELRPHLDKNGGNIIMLQVENEYGSYGNDKTYLRAIEDMYREFGMDCALFTSDGPCSTMVGGGSLDGLLEVANFGSRGREAFEFLKTLRPNQPVMCGEFWNGWFDHWYEDHHVRSAEDAAAALDEILSANGSVNLFMFHGGTNFGFTNGANHGGKYEPTITSYDYNSPCSECGELTPKFYAFKEVIEKHFGKVPEIAVSNPKLSAYGKLKLTEYAPLIDNFKAMANRRVESPAPLSMEEIGQDFGFIMYSVDVAGPIDESKLTLLGLHDRAHIYVNGELKGIKERDRRDDEVTLKLGVGESAHIDILVENMGRINYGYEMGYEDKKGIFALRCGTWVSGFTMYSLPMEDFSSVKWGEAPCDAKCPGLLRGNLKIDGKPADTFVLLDNFEKGFVIVNGHNIGRYFNTAGPQRTLYIPAPFLKSGDNEIIVFESDACHGEPVIEFVDRPDYG